MAGERIRVSQHSGRTGSGGHNDRSFLKNIPKEQETNIDRSRCKDNEFWSWTDELTEDEYDRLTDLVTAGDLDISSDFTFDEMAYYRATFQTALDKQNEKHLQGGHRNRIKTMEQLYASKRYCPEETILQIGKMGNTVDSAVFTDCINDYMDYLDEWNESHGKPMKILNCALHVDEATPHVHMRRVWQYTDEGVTRIGQEEALKRAEVELPNPAAPNGQHNNRKMTFDKMMREKWIQICMDHGLDIETEPVSGSHHVSTKAYARRQDDERRKKEAKLEEDQKAFERRCAEREAELARRTRDVWNREQAVTRSEAQIGVKRNEADKILSEAKTALKTAQNASETAINWNTYMELRDIFENVTVKVKQPNGTFSAEQQLLKFVNAGLKQKHDVKVKAPIRKGWTAADELQSKADYMKQRDAQQSDDQQYT